MLVRHLVSSHPSWVRPYPVFKDHWEPRICDINAGKVPFVVGHVHPAVIVDFRIRYSQDESDDDWAFIVRQDNRNLHPPGN